MVYSCFIKDVKSVFCTFFPGSVCRSADMLARPNTRSALPWRVRKFTAGEEECVPVIPDDSSPEIVEKVKRLVI